MTRERLSRALPWLVGAAVIAPIALTTIAQHAHRWSPIADLAMTELRVRDVGGRHSPLIGLQGRIGETGSHPGPLSFYLLAPVYRLLGSSAFALQVATGVFHAAAAATTLWIVHRRKQPLLVIGVGVVLLLLIQGYGLGTLTEPWNPYLPVLWFVAFLAAAWAVVDGDLPMILPCVVAASICAQTHVPYVGVTGGIGAVTVAFAVGRLALQRRRRLSAAAPEPDVAVGTIRPARWFAAAAVIGLLLWTPPVVDEIVREPGNFSVIVDYFGDPPEEDLGVRQAAVAVQARLDAWHLVVLSTAHPGTYVDILTGPGPTAERGGRTLGVWLVAAAAAVAMRHRRLLALHGVVAVGGAVAVVAISRIFGAPWPYLMHWAFSLGALMALSIVWTAGALALRAWPRLVQTTGWRTGTLVVGALAVGALSARLLVIAPDARPHTPELTDRLGRVAPATADGLDEGAGDSTGQDGRYYLFWDDSMNGGSDGIGLVNELIRRGFDIGVPEGDGVKIVPFRVRDPADATARIVLVTGEARIGYWAAEPGAVRVAFDDTRTASQKADYARIRAEVIAILHDLGRDDLVPQVDENLYNIALNEKDLAPSLALPISKLFAIGTPLAVFVLPPAGSA